MASMLGKAAAPVAKKVLHDKAQQRFANFAAPDYDPKYEYKEVNGKMKKVKKDVADYVPENDARILKHVRKWAHRMDTCLTVNLGCVKGTYGWAFWIGLFPEVGDVVNIIISLMLLRRCNKIKGGLPWWDNLAIFAFIFSDFLVGLVPLIGDLGDAYLKANRFMAQRLETHLDKIHDPFSTYNIKRRNKGQKAPPVPLDSHQYDPEKAIIHPAPHTPAVPPPVYTLGPKPKHTQSDTAVPLRFKQPPAARLSPDKDYRAATNPRKIEAERDVSPQVLSQHEQQPPSRFGRYAGEVFEIAKPYAKPAAKSALDFAKSRHEQRRGPPAAKTKIEFI